jgi:hypothetical protein
VGELVWKPYYLLGRRAISLASGHQIGMVLIKWSKSWVVILIC